ncbi:hypothetical protein KC721_00555 [Candidatus Woesebacteria bacterium]|nr:hypothetical protein [Candidatus Woesebacteria bacterium]
MATIESPEKISDVPKALIKNMIFLATSGFGVVVALAWNEFIKEVINEYIAPYFAGSGIISLFIYAVVVTTVAVVVIMQLSALEKKLGQIENMLEKTVQNGRAKVSKKTASKSKQK